MRKIHRASSILVPVSTGGTSVEIGQSYTVHVNPAGGVASASSVLVAGTGTKIFLRRGHGFSVGDKLITLSNGQYSTDNFSVVSEVTVAWVIVSTTLSTITEGTVVINLGVDSGGTSPAYDGGDVRFSIYSDPGGIESITDNGLTTDNQGTYEYWHDGNRLLWELIRDPGGTPVGLQIVETMENRVNLGYEKQIELSGNGFDAVHSAYQVDGEGSANDDLQNITISGSGSLLLVRPASGITITIKHEVVSVGNITVPSTNDIELDSVNEFALLYAPPGSNWLVLLHNGTEV